MLPSPQAETLPFLLYQPSCPMISIDRERLLVGHKTDGRIRLPHVDQKHPRTVVMLLYSPFK
jgi:hypothetical protein